MRLVLLLLSLTLLAGCTRARDVETAYTVYLPAVAYDCSWLCYRQQYLEAVANCEDRMLRLRASEGRVRMPDDCEQPGPEDWE